MADDRQTRLRALFDRAVDLPLAERGAFIARECGADADLGRRLEELLAAADDEHFLAAVALPEPAPNAGAKFGEQQGEVIGPYKLLQQIGEGGFGTVWMAEQREPVRRRVAFKILKLGMDTRQVVARFEQEREALALMDHPNIARALDAGATATGRPYFVMELVNGVPVLEYCDRERLDLRARLALFVDICRAIQHAHQKGIIHRDIKPSNVLVTLHDGRPVPKVIDFGIAKATHAEVTVRTLFTEHRQMIGTPAYMSPEQAEMSGLDVDTRTDVYSLGVLLYEMLTGTTPFDIRSLLERGFDEMLRTIREVEPHRPSTRVSSLGASASALADRRKLDVRRLGMFLRGDLDWIVMRCLEKDRERRYETANGLALDIVRYLQGEAVLAAPPSALYRLRKVARRNRGTVAAGAVIVAALIAGLAGTLWQARVAARERNAAHEAARQADERATQLGQVARFQERMLRDIDGMDAGAQLMSDIRARHAAALATSAVPEERRAESADQFSRELARVNATDAAVAIVEATILAPAVAAVETEFAEQPGVSATLRQSLANIYTLLGRYEQADVLQTAALETRRRTLGPEHQDTLRSLNDSAHLLEMQGRYAEAEPLYRAAWEGRQRTLGAEHPDTLSALGNLAGNLRFQGRLVEAEPLAREALELSRRVLGPEQRDTLVRANVLGYVLVDQGKLAEAEPYWREAYETGRRVFGAADPDGIVWTNNLGGLIGALGRRSESEALYREALEGARSVHGEEHPFTLTCLSNVASALRSQARLTEAESLSREVLERRRRLLGDDHPDTLSSIGSLGAVLRDQGKLAEAEVQLRAVFDWHERTLGREHPETLESAAILAAALAALSRTGEAEQLYLRTLAAPPSVWGEEHPDRLISLNNLGNLYLQQQRPAEAEPLLRKAFETRQRVSGAEHPETLVAQSGFARVLEDQGRRAEAEVLYRDATEKFRRVLGPRHPNTLSSISNVAGVLLEQQRYAEAESFYREALAGFEGVLGPNHARTGGTRRGLGRTLAALERFAEAETELLEAERALCAAQGVSPERIKACRESLVALYEAWERHEPGQGHGAKADSWRGR